MEAWNSTESDLENILHAHYDSPDGPLCEDDLMNALLGVKQAHNLRMQKLFHTFKQIIKDKSFDPKLGVVPNKEWYIPPALTKEECHKFVEEQKKKLEFLQKNIGEAND